MRLSLETSFQFCAPSSERYRPPSLHPRLDICVAGYRGDGHAHAAQAFATAGRGRSVVPNDRRRPANDRGRSLGLRWRINTPGRAARLPECGVNGLLIAGFKREVDGAGVFVFEKNALPGLAAILRAENAALGICAVGMAQRAATKRRLASSGSTRMRPIWRVSSRPMCAQTFHRRSTCNMPFPPETEERMSASPEPNVITS